MLEGGCVVYRAPKRSELSLVVALPVALNASSFLPLALATSSLSFFSSRGQLLATSLRNFFSSCSSMWQLTVSSSRTSLAVLESPWQLSLNSSRADFRNAELKPHSEPSLSAHFFCSLKPVHFH